MSYLRIKLKHHRSAADDKIFQRQEQMRQEQLKAAVQYCNDKGCKGYAAIKTGLFPMIMDARTINRRLSCTPLNKRIVPGSEKQHLRLLTTQEEEMLVQHMKNRNRACMGMTKKEVEDMILDMLKMRKHINSMSTGRKFIKLSENAHSALAKKRVGRGFWRRFYVKYPDVMHKHPGTVSINCALNCTREMAETYLDETRAH